MQINYFIAIIAPLWNVRVDCSKLHCLLEALNNSHACMCCMCLINLLTQDAKIPTWIKLANAFYFLPINCKRYYHIPFEKSHAITSRSISLRQPEDNGIAPFPTKKNKCSQLQLKTNHIPLEIKHTKDKSLIKRLHTAHVYPLHRLVFQRNDMHKSELMVGKSRMKN